nr:hypothetical protein [Deltaproteobacteria bacterium]
MSDPTPGMICDSKMKRDQCPPPPVGIAPRTLGSVAATRCVYIPPIDWPMMMKRDASKRASVTPVGSEAPVHAASVAAGIRSRVSASSSSRCSKMPWRKVSRIADGFIRLR